MKTLKLILVLLSVSLTNAFAAFQSDEELESYLRELSECEGRLKPEWPRLYPHTQWVIEVDASQLNPRTEYQRTQEVLKSAGVTIAQALGFESEDRTSRYLLGTLDTKNLDDLKQIPGFKAATILVTVHIKEAFRKRAKFDELAGRLKEEGFNWFHPGLSESLPQSLTGSVSPEQFESLANVPGVKILEQAWFIEEQHRGNAPRGIHIKGVPALVNVLGAELMITGRSAQKVSGTFYFTGGLELQSRHNGNTTLQMSGEVEAYKQPHAAIIQKFRDAGFSVHRETNGFSVPIIFSGKENPSNSSQGSLGALRKILSSSPEVELVYLNEMESWKYRPTK